MSRLQRIEVEEDLLRAEVVDLLGDMVEVHKMGLSTVISLEVQIVTGASLLPTILPAV